MGLGKMGSYCPTCGAGEHGIEGCKPAPRASAPRFVVQATILGIGPITCSRPYPRSDDHLECFSYPDRAEAERFAAVMAERFPANSYAVAPV
jgi:hypothetical protein